MPPRVSKKTPATSSATKPSPKLTAKKVSEVATVPTVTESSAEPEEVPVVESGKTEELKTEDVKVEEAEQANAKAVEVAAVEDEANGEVQENGESQADQGTEPEEEKDTEAEGNDMSDTIEEGDVDGKSGSDTEEEDESGEEEDESGEEDEDEDEDEDEEDHSVYMHAPLTERKKEKEFEIFVGGLDKGADEEDLIKVFGEFGEIKSVRIAKNPVSQKSKGFGFIRYGTVEQAKKALADLNEPEVKGKKVRISACLDNDTLYVGNICKTWTKTKVLETLKEYGVDQIEDMFLPDDPKDEGQSKGFVHLEFTTHSDAMMAFQRLRKPDAIFGCNLSARVAFTQSSMHPSEEALSQVKTVYVEALPTSWDEEKVKEHCKQYGEIEKVELSRNFLSAKRKDYGFITFTTRESAIACVEGVNKAEIGEGEAKIKANIAKPQNSGRLAKQGALGGFRVKDGESSGASREGRSKSKGRKDRVTESRGRSRSKPEPAKGAKRFKSLTEVAEGGLASKKKKAEALKKEKDDHQKKAPANWKNKRGGRGSARGRSNMGFGKRGTPWVVRHQQASYPARPASYKRRYSDLEPHAGYLEPAAKQSRAPIGYGQSRRLVGYGNQRRSAGAYGGAVHSPAYLSDYPADHSTHAGYEGSYGYSRVSGYTRRPAYY